MDAALPVAEALTVRGIRVMFVTGYDRELLPYAVAGLCRPQRDKAATGPRLDTSPGRGAGP